MNILYISTRIPKPLRKNLLRQVKIYNGVSGEVHSNSIFSGLSENQVEMCNVNIPPIGHFPKMNKRFFTFTTVCEENGYKITNMGSCNLFVYQHFSIYHHLLATLKNLRHNNDFDIILVYSLQKPLVTAAQRFRNTFSPKSKIVVIVPDLVEDMYAKKDLFTSLQKRLFEIDKMVYDDIDGFVYLSEHMKERISETKPYCVVEGLYDLKEGYIPPHNDGKDKIVFYSGKLHEKFGIKHLIDAFMFTTNPDLRLQLCGKGDCEDYIEAMKQKDCRIVYLGQLAREKVLEFQSRATLLVNPRLPVGEFTRYSFPSKNIQYLSSGIPALIYQLPGIPKEYYNHCFSLSPDDLSVDTLSVEIEKISNISQEQLTEIGREAREWVITNKNEKVQCQRIIDFMNKLK